MNRQLPIELVEKLKELWRDQKTGSEIALTLGMTRNAVMGMLNRLRVKGELGYRKLEFKGRTPTPRAPRIPALNPRAPRVKSTVVVDTPRVSAEPAKVLCLVPLQNVPRPYTPPPENGVKLTDLEWYHCRWAIKEVRPKEFRFCGAHKKEKSSYCAEHHALVYLPKTRPPSKPGGDRASDKIFSWRALQ
jgi:hypothetical protein